MSEQQPAEPSIRLLVIMNPRGGTAHPEEIRTVLAQHFPSPAYQTTIYETTGEEDLPALVRDYHPAQFAMIVAIGGDGTLSDVAEALVGSDVPLGIIPAGTGNVLAHDLGIPLNLTGAAGLLAGEHTTLRIDAMQVQQHTFVVSIGCGIDSLMVRDTTREAKRRFGRLAYAWSILKRLIGYQQPRFIILADGQRIRRRALQVLIANSAAVGLEPFRWGNHIRPDDGTIDVCIVSARTLRDLFLILWAAVRGKQRATTQLRYLSARRSITLVATPPLPVQADGELIGDTPVQVTVLPQAVRVIVPIPPAPAEPSS